MLLGRPLVACALVAILLAGCATPGAGPAPSSPSAAAPTSAPSGGAAASPCTASPEMMLGPYFIDGEAVRRDIRPDANRTGGTAGMEEESPDEEFIDGVPERSEVRFASSGEMQEGVRLDLAITVHGRLADGSCAPMRGARVDLWHANAHGRYSGFLAEGTAGEHWLRGAQVTDGNGTVQFTTIWPGWYPGRAVHIHVKVRQGGLDFTSQFFFDPAMNAEVMADHPPYSSRPTPDVPNERDGIYRQGGNAMLLLTAEGDGSYTGSKSIVVL